MVGGGALVNGRRRVHRAAYARRREVGFPFPFPFRAGATRGAVFRRSFALVRARRALGGVVIATAAAQAPLGELHVVEQLPVARGEARGAAARLALGELAEGRQGVEVGGHRAGRRDPPPLHRLEEPPEHFAHARWAGGTRHGEERLGKRAALAAAQAPARTQTLNLVRETLEVRVEHLFVCAFEIRRVEFTTHDANITARFGGPGCSVSFSVPRAPKSAAPAKKKKRRRKNPRAGVSAARFQSRNRRPLRRTAGRRVGRLGEAAARGGLSRGSIRRAEWWYRTAI